MNILLIEDNLSILKGLNYAFLKNNYHLICKKSYIDAKNYLLSKEKVELIILDITLPDGNGYDLYNKVIKDLNIPTVFLTACDDEDKIVECLNNGAEDYITKPFSIKELLARVNKILLRVKKDSVINVKNITFYLDKLMLYKDDELINLTALELKIINLLFINIGKVVTRDTLLDKIWEWTGNYVSDHTITVYFNRLRDKIGTDIITTIKGIGYRIDEK